MMDAERSRPVVSVRQDRATPQGEEYPAGPLSPRAIVRTGLDGRIVSANTVASRLLNVSPRAAVGRSLLAFFDGEPEKLARQMASATLGQISRVTAALRPRERKPFRVGVEITLALDVKETHLDWTFEVIPPHGDSE